MKGPPKSVVTFQAGPTDWESVGLIAGVRDHNWVCQDIRCQGLLLLDALSALGIITSQSLIDKFDTRADVLSRILASVQSQPKMIIRQY